MKSLLHGRIEPVELYVEVRAILEAGALDHLVDTTFAEALASTEPNCTPPADVFVHVARGARHGAAAISRDAGLRAIGRGPGKTAWFSS